MINYITVIFIKILNILLNLAKKNGGNILGKIAIKFNKNIFNFFKVNCPVIAVTATNGKTSTNNCIQYILSQAKLKVVCNKEGNNMDTGILSTLLKNCTISGKIKADFLCFEVDESYVPIIFKSFRLDTLIVLNFFRDQLDRNGEVETLILKINDFLKTFNGNLILNNDDPNVSRLGKANPNNKKVYYFSCEKYKYATETMKEAGEGKFCPFCKTKLVYSYYQYSHIGKFKCLNCGYGDNKIYKYAYNINLEKRCFDVDGITYNIPESNIYTIYNHLAVLSVCSLYNIDTEIILKSFKNFSLNNGRAEEMLIKNCESIINLAKNPTGANVSLRMLNENEASKDLLFVLNDNLADGKDVSWIWDINFDKLNNVDRIVTSGTRAYDIAIRIKTAGFNENKIFPFLDMESALEKLYETSNVKYIIANYTALQPTRMALKKFIN